MAKNNIPTFVRFVIPMLFLAAGAEAESGFRPFVTIGSDVLATSAADAPTHPRLRVSGEIGTSIPFPDPLRLAFSVGGMHVEPSIPSDSILYRGYSGAFVAASLGNRGRAREGTAPFLTVGGSCAVASYTDTELYFISYSIQAVPGLAAEYGRLELRLSLPLKVDLQGDGASVSAGMAITIAAGGRRATREER